MALQQLPGQTGLFFSRASSNDKRVIGKFTDRNHLSSFHSTEPQDYDKKIIDIYTQSMMYSNDFLTMINKSTPFYLTGNTDTFQWGMAKPYQFPTLLSVPDSTLSQNNIGIDGKPFELIIDTDEFKKNAVVILGSRQFGVNIYATTDPRPASGRSWVQEFVLSTTNPQSDTVPRNLLKAGVTLQFSHTNIGEFDQEGQGADRFGDKLQLFETLGSGELYEHTITAWADERTLRDGKGNPLDILVYGVKRRGEIPTSANALKWEPLVEAQLRKKALDAKVSKFVWAKPGTFRTGGNKQELKKESAGIHWKMRNSGNYIPYYRGEFSVNLIKEAFGTLFYRREDIAKRHVKMYTNEAGLNTWEQALKEDALGSGISLVSNVNAISAGTVNASSPSQNLVYSFAFGSMYSRATGLVEVVHLKELDQPQTNMDYGQNKMSTPIFMIFNISPDSDGQLTNNIREVRRSGQPSQTWGYIDGRWNHLGFAASQGHSAANMFNGYKFFIDDRYDVFVEDMSRTFLIEEIPNY